MIEGQLSRYGAIARFLPFTTGKTFFLVNASEAAAADFLNGYQRDKDGVDRVYTTWAAVISACQADTGADAIVVSPLFTTAPTLAQIDALKAAHVSVVQAGDMLPDGSYLATKAAVAFDSATTQNLFTVTGKVKILNLIGEIATTFSAATTFARFQHVPDVGSTSDLCVSTDIKSLALGAQLSITGVLSATIVATTQGAIVDQASAVVLKAGTLKFGLNQTTTGNIRYSVAYKPLEPGALIFPA